MTKARQKFNIGTLYFTVFLALMIGVTFLPVEKWTKVVSIIALGALYLFLRRSFFYFAKAAKQLQKDNTNPAAWENFKKAIACGMEDERVQLVGSAFVQQGDADSGVKILEDLIAKTKKKDVRNEAISSLSMGYWRQGRLEKAIEVLLQLEKDGYNDDNMIVNLETYLLEHGDLDEAWRVIDKRAQSGTETNGMLDNKGWYYILRGEWDKAAVIYDELVDERNAKFPEAYLHAVQVKIHEGDIAQAIERIEYSLEKRFLMTCGVSKSYLETLKLGLENPATRDGFARAMEENAALVSCGKEFPGFETACEFDRSLIEKDSSADEDDVDDSSDDDDREPNTDLDDEDFDEDEGNEDSTSPNTDVDDDDREPNTDLDEEDLK